MPRRAADYPGAFSDWNFISTLGVPLRRHRRSAPPCDFFLRFLLADGGGDVHHASDFIMASKIDRMVDRPA
jgi:hypothetical protein